MPGNTVVSSTAAVRPPVLQKKVRTQFLSVTRHAQHCVNPVLMTSLKIKRRSDPLTSSLLRSCKAWMLCLDQRQHLLTISRGGFSCCLTTHCRARYWVPHLGHLLAGHGCFCVVLIKLCVMTISSLPQRKLGLQRLKVIPRPSLLH